MGNEQAWLIIIGVVLLGFGAGYNLLVAWLEDTHRMHGYEWFLVIGGVVVTLWGLGVVAGWTVAQQALILFACSGGPMAIGAVWRAMQRRAAEESDTHNFALRKLREIDDDDPEES
jgi:hypothetical protein